MNHINPADIRILHETHRNGSAVVRTNLQDIIRSCRIKKEGYTHDALISGMMEKVKKEFLYSELDEDTYEKMQKFSIDYLNKLIDEGVITYCRKRG